MGEKGDWGVGARDIGGKNREETRGRLKREFDCKDGEIVSSEGKQMEGKL